MPLTQTQKDLNRFAQGKLYALIKDVVQSFDIAGEERSDALACLGSLMMRLTATMALHGGADRERWIEMCNDVYEVAKEIKEQLP